MTRGSGMPTGAAGIAAATSGGHLAGGLGQHVVFGGEVPEERAAADAGGIADVGHGDVAVPALGEQGKRRVDGCRTVVDAVAFSEVHDGVSPPRR